MVSGSERDRGSFPAQFSPSNRQSPDVSHRSSCRNQSSIWAGFWVARLLSQILLLYHFAKSKYTQRFPRLWARPGINPEPTLTHPHPVEEISGAVVGSICFWGDYYMKIKQMCVYHTYSKVCILLCKRLYYIIKYF